MLNDFNNITNTRDDDIQISLLSTGLGFKQKNIVSDKSFIKETIYTKNSKLNLKIKSEKKIFLKEVSGSLKFLSLLSDTLLIFIVSHIEYLLAMKLIFLGFQRADSVYFIAILLNNLFLYCLLTFRNPTISENILNITINKRNKFIFCFRLFSKSSTYYVS